jgi:peptidylprolyl isomerase
MAAKTGDKVRVHYTGKLDDGTIFDSSAEAEPLEFVLGEGQILPGFEAAILGLGTGESRTFKIPADEAYGPHRDDHVVTLPLDELPSYLRPKLGDVMEIQQPGGKILAVRITSLTDTEIELDGNHPLAGQDLTFETTLVEIL